MDRLQKVNYYPKQPYRPVCVQQTLVRNRLIECSRDRQPTRESARIHDNSLIKLRLHDLLNYKQRDRCAEPNRFSYYKHCAAGESVRKDDLNKTQPKISIYHNQGSTSKQHRYAKVSQSFNTSTPILNKSVSRFTPLTPNKSATQLAQRIREQKVESLFNLIINNQQQKL